MSTVVSAVYQWEGKTTDQKLEKYLREYKMPIRVICSDGNMDHNTLLSTTGTLPLPHGSSGPAVTLPAIGTTLFPTDSGSLCVGVNVRQSQNIYDLVYDFSSNPPISQLRNQDPTARAPIYTVTFQKFKTAITQSDTVATITNVALTSNVATITVSQSESFIIGTTVVIAGLTTTALNGTWTITGLPTLQTFTFAFTHANIPSTADNGTATGTVAILNSAGQPFEQPLQIDAAYAVIEIEKNYSTYDLQSVIDLQNTINKADWTPTGQPGTAYTFPAYSCKMDTLQVTPKEENQIPYQALKFRVLYNSDLWYPVEVLDCGYNQNIDGNLVQITDKGGAPLQKPSLLDGSGLESDSPIYLPFDAYTQADWSSIP